MNKGKIFQGQVFCCTGILPTERASLQGLVERYGGQWSRHLTNKVTILLTKRAENSEKYKMAIQLHLSMYHPDLFYALEEKEQQSQLSCFFGTQLTQWMESYRVRTLTGIKVCITGLALDVRENLRFLIEKHGGEYYSDLTKSVTHLIAPASNPSETENNKEGLKVKFAKKWSIPIIKAQWLHASIHCGYLLDEKEFLICEEKEQILEQCMVICDSIKHESPSNTILSGSSKESFIKVDGFKLFYGHQIILGDGFDKSIIEYFNKNIRYYGGTCDTFCNFKINHMTSHQALVYVIAGSQWTNDDKKFVKTLDRKNLNIIKSTWLYECFKEEKILGFEAFLMKDENLNSLDAIGDFGFKDTTKLDQSMKNKARDMISTKEDDVGQIKKSQLLLNGYSVYILGNKQDAKIRKLTKWVKYQCGNVLSDLPKTNGIDPNQIFIITCQWFYTDSKDLAKLRTYTSQGYQIRTDHWLERSITCSRLLPSGIQVSITGFECLEKEYLLELWAILQWNPLNTYFNKRMHLLLCPALFITTALNSKEKDDEGRLHKFTSASKWNIPAVSIQWLWTCLIKLGEYGELEDMGAFVLNDISVATLKAKLMDNISRAENASSFSKMNRLETTLTQHSNGGDEPMSFLLQESQNTPLSVAAERTLATAFHHFIKPSLVLTTSNQIFKDCRICFSSKLWHRRETLSSYILAGGGSAFWTIHNDMTHFVHIGSTNRCKDAKLAKSKATWVVSPWWIIKSMEVGKRLKEETYPSCYEPNKALILSKVDASDDDDGSEIIEEKNNTTVKVEPNKENIHPSSNLIQWIDHLLLSSNQRIEAEKAKGKENNREPHASLISLLSSTANSNKRAKMDSSTTYREASSGVYYEESQKSEHLFLRSHLKKNPDEVVDHIENDLIKRSSSRISSDSSSPSLDASQLEISKKKVFLCSGLKPNQMKDYESKLNKTIGLHDYEFYSVDTLGAWKENCSHLIVAGAPSKSEKYLSALASGKWILKKSFLEEAIKNNTWPEEEAHEWSEIDASVLPSGIEPGLLTAPKHWRLKIQQSSQKKAFCDWRVILDVSEKKKPGLTRLLITGGAKLFDSVSLSKYSGILTHVFVEAKSRPDQEKMLHIYEQWKSILYQAELIAEFLLSDDATLQELESKYVLR